MRLICQFLFCKAFDHIFTDKWALLFCRYEEFRTRLAGLKARADNGLMSFRNTLMAHINDADEPGAERFDVGEVIRGLYRMDTEEGSIMVDGDSVIFI